MLKTILVRPKPEYCRAGFAASSSEGSGSSLLGAERGLAPASAPGASAGAAKLPGPSARPVASVGAAAGGSRGDGPPAELGLAWSEEGCRLRARERFRPRRLGAERLPDLVEDEVEGCFLDLDFLRFFECFLDPERLRGFDERFLACERARDFGRLFDLEAFRDEELVPEDDGDRFFEAERFRDLDCSLEVELFLEAGGFFPDLARFRGGAALPEDELRDGDEPASFEQARPWG
mmetsp:Transcript_48047/g.153331  ORF Transcript_48047/g.153331 Transcript_48047/m.153331 type:complete len:234 (+) Transcript_48047:340-1041(+)